MDVVTEKAMVIGVRYEVGGLRALAFPSFESMGANSKFTQHRSLEKCLVFKCTFLRFHSQ